MSSPVAHDVTGPAEIFGLDGRIAIITGASSGLGDRFARVLSAAGAQVVGAARRADRLERGSGSLINIASMYGLVASAPVMQASYCASKGAVVHLTRELGAQWARRGVRVNALAPGFFPSEMAAEMIEDEQSARFLRRNT